MKKILIFGDSIVVGRGVAKNKTWASRLSGHFDTKDKWDTIVYNLGVPGESTSELLKRFIAECKTRIQHPSPQEETIIFVAEGINDSKGIGSPQAFKTSPEDFRQNIRKLIETGKRYTETLIFVGPTPVNENKTAPTGDNYFLNPNIRKYNNIIKDICKKENIAFVELLTDWDRFDYKKFLLADGIHPNKTGHQKIFEKVIHLINN